MAEGASLPVHLRLPEQVEWRLWPTMRPTPPSTTNPPTTHPVVLCCGTFFLCFGACFLCFVFLIRMRKGAPLLCVQYLSTKLRCTDGTATAVRYVQDGSEWPPRSQDHEPAREGPRNRQGDRSGSRDRRPEVPRRRHRRCELPRVRAEHGGGAVLGNCRGPCTHKFPGWVVESLSCFF